MSGTRITVEILSFNRASKTPQTHRALFTNGKYTRAGRMHMDECACRNMYP